MKEQCDLCGTWYLPSTQGFSASGMMFCSNTCAEKYFGPAQPPTPPGTTPAPDEQRGWKWTRFVNQKLKRPRAVYRQRKEDLDFWRIQRRERRRSR